MPSKIISPLNVKATNFSQIIILLKCQIFGDTQHDLYNISYPF